MKALVSLLLVCVSVAHGQPSPSVAVGAGTLPCGKWIDARAKRMDNADLYELGIASWVQGFISALNVAGNEAPVNLPEPSTVTAFLDKWCRDNPLMEPWGGGFALMAELRKQQRKNR